MTSYTFLYIIFTKHLKLMHNGRLCVSACLPADSQLLVKFSLGGLHSALLSRVILIDMCQCVPHLHETATNVYHFLRNNFSYNSFL
jgi:hypothetical protein